MRTRYLKPGFFENEHLAELHPVARLLFAGLWLIADKKGRLKDRPARIKGELFPYDSTNVEKHLKTLEAAGFIKRYQADGQPLIWIPTFSAHQKPHHHEPDSTLPGHPDDPCSDSDAPVSSPSPDNVATSPGRSRASKSNAYENSKSNEYENAAVEAADPPAHPFAFTYAQKHRERTQSVLDPVRHGRALSLENEYGTELCMQVAEEKGWDKHPNYYTDALKERRDGNGTSQRNGAAKQSAGSPYLSAADDIERRGYA